jgi:glycosyltransferase 2 family protein
LLRVVAKVLIVALVLWFVRGAIVEAWKQLGQQAWHFDIRWLAVAGGLYLLGLVPAALFWHRLLRALGQDVGLGETLRAYFIGHLGKYVPGKAMVIVLRTGLIRGQQVDTGLAVASVFLETLTMMSAGACMAAAILAVSFSPQRPLLWTALVMIVIAGLPTLPPVAARLARLAGIGRGNPAAADRLAGLPYRTLAGGWLSMAVCWLLSGASLAAVLQAMGFDAGRAWQLHLDTATVALGVVGGFVSMMPGGLIVREAVVTGLLGSQLGDAAAALIAAALLRLVWLVAEGLISVILYFYR